MFSQNKLIWLAGLDGSPGRRLPKSSGRAGMQFSGQLNLSSIMAWREEALTKLPSSRVTSI